MAKIFEGFLMGGFECSTHRKRSGQRLDLIAATRHDEFAEQDYRRLLDVGMRTARDGFRWHLIEQTPNRYDFASAERQAAAAHETGIRVIWDLFHYGFPDDIDLFDPCFIERFAQFSVRAAEFLQRRTDGPLLICPVNEISFFSWIAGEVGRFQPAQRNRGDELKRQLVRAAIATMDAVRSVAPDTVFIHTEPAIHVIGAKNNPKSQRAAERYRRAQFHALDMLRGTREPELGGGPEYLPVIGLNYYFHNQWRYPNRRKIPLGHDDYRPLHEILAEFHKRYDRPLIIAETGIEDDERPTWFGYVCDQVRAAIANGVPVHGICLYPIVNHPGWEDERHCHNGLWDYLDDGDEREPFEPLRQEVLRQAALFDKMD